MSKFFKVDVTTVETMVIEVEDEEGEEIALSIAMDQRTAWSSTNAQADSAVQLMTLDEIERAKAHADQFVPLE